MSGRFESFIETSKWIQDRLSGQSQPAAIVKEIIAEYKKQKKQELLADRLSAYFKERKVFWNISNDKNEAIALDAGLIFVLQKLHATAASRYIGGKVYDYILIVFECGDEIFFLRNFCDEPCYDSRSFRIPVMDLYDVAVSGSRRKPKTAHVCGLAGFDPTRGDSCPAC